MGRILDIPSDVLRDMQAALDDVHDLKVKPCRLIYPPRLTACSCVVDPIGKKPYGYGLHGGPLPTPNLTNCPMCGGTGKKQTEQSEVIDLAVNWHPSQYQKIGDQTIRLPAGSILTKGYINLLPKVVRAQELIVNIDLEGYIKYRYKLYGEPIDPYSIFRSHYFMAFWERIA